MRTTVSFVLLVMVAGPLAWAQPRDVSVKVSFGERLGPLEIDRMALGRGGLSDEPMWGRGTADAGSPISYLRGAAAAVPRAHPQAAVGGPALANVPSTTLPALLDACDKDKIPLHFTSWHIYSSSPSRVRGTIDHAMELLRKHPA